MLVVLEDGTRAWVDKKGKGEAADRMRGRPSCARGVLPRRRSVGLIASPWVAPESP